MRTYYLDTNIPDLYLDEEAQTPFMFPFNVAGILFKVEDGNYKPLWTTSDLLKIVGKDDPENRLGRTTLKSLIDHKILVGYDLIGFRQALEEVIQKKKEIQTFFPSREYESKIPVNYFPFFIPLFQKKKGLSHVLFYLDNILEKSVSQKFESLKSKKNGVVKGMNSYHVLMDKYEKPIIEINSHMQVDKFNSKAKDLFPILKKGKNFLDLWNRENQHILINALESVENDQEISFICFEKIQRINIKLKISLINLSHNHSIGFLAILENLNTSTNLEREITKKGMLLHLTQAIGQDLEQNNPDFINKTYRNILEAYDFNGMYWLPFSQEQEQAQLTLFPKQQAIPINKEIYTKHYKAFRQLSKGYIKRIEIEKILPEDFVASIDNKKSKYLIVVPIYEEDMITGTLVYMGKTKIMDIDLYNHLYSLSVLYHKIMIYQKVISKYENYHMNEN